MIPPLRLALEKRDIYGAIALINGGAVDPDEFFQDPTRHWPNLTALYISAAENYPELAKAALENGAEVDRTYGPFKQTALMRVSIEGNIEILKLLIQYGASIDMETTGGETALIYSAARGHTEIVKLLVENGADVHHVGSFEYTAADWAYWKNHRDALKFLQQNGYYGAPYQPQRLYREIYRHYQTHIKVLGGIALSILAWKVTRIVRGL
jgi:ankyrin repeat protein